jgi:chromosome segregation ATPase
LSPGALGGVQSDVKRPVHLTCERATVEPADEKESCNVEPHVMETVPAVNAGTKAVANLKAEIAAINAEIGDLEFQIEELRDEVETLEERRDELEEELDDLEDEEAVAEGD